MFCLSMQTLRRISHIVYTELILNHYQELHTHRSSGSPFKNNNVLFFPLLPLCVISAF